MKRPSAPIILVVAAGLAAASCAGPARSREAAIADVLANNEDVTILITDSGLGGLSVAADVAARLSGSGVFRKARIVFYNALFHKIGYNGLDSEAEKARIFDVALRDMEKRYRPDILLIACNTLSVVYNDTRFSRRPAFPVVGIVETGVDLIAEQFAKTPDADVLIFATKTTIESEAHKKALVARGLPAGRIFGQACHKLAGAIERGTASEETVGYIRQFVGEALAQAGGPGRPLFGSFNCTHYGYARRQFAEAFAAAGVPDIVLLDPNPRMADFLFRAPYLGRHPGTEVAVEVVSKLEITPQERDSIGPLLRAVSPAAADALQNYTHDPQLFEVEFKRPAGK
jgi:glutamate racemase